MTDYERLKNIIDEIDVLIEKRVTSSDSSFIAWKTKAERFLIKNFGEKSYEYNQFKKIHFSFLIYTFDTDDSAFVSACLNGLDEAKAVLQTYLEEIQEECEEKLEYEKVVQAKNFSKIFIVHGHDEALKQSVARLIEKQNIEAIILSEKANKGKTIIEKLEENSDVDCAICLFSPDDTGKANKEKDYKARARQNVVLEAGFFMGKLGREHVVYIAKDGLEMPSDLQGVVYTNATNWQVDLLRELKAMGYTVDFNKLF